MQGFLAAFLKGKPVEDAVKIAHAVATQSIQAYDVFSSIKDFGATSELVKSGMPKISLEIEGAILEIRQEFGCMER